jgi:hypothetical protein
LEKELQGQKKEKWRRRRKKTSQRQAKEVDEGLQKE